MEEGSFFEPFGPVYARPVGPDCPDCDCCTKALCDAARDQAVNSCSAHSNAPDLVAGCPCPTRKKE